MKTNTVTQDKNNQTVTFLNKANVNNKKSILTNAISIRDLLSYRLHVTANAFSRSAAVRFRREFDVSLGEWRTIALLGVEPDLSLNQLARAANLDKGQMSRVVSALVRRGLVLRVGGDKGGRTISLSLTRSGESTYRGLIEIASQRNSAFLACLTAKEHACLDSALTKLTTLARAMTHGDRLKTSSRSRK